MKKIGILFILLATLNIVKAQTQMGMMYSVTASEEQLKKTKTIVLFNEDLKEDIVSIIKAELDKSWSLSELIYLEREIFLEDFESYKNNDGFSFLAFSRKFYYEGNTMESDDVVSAMLCTSLTKKFRFKFQGKMFASSHVSQNLYDDNMVASRLIQILHQTVTEEAARNKFWNVIDINDTFIKKLSDNVLHIPVFVPDNSTPEKKETLIAEFKSKMKDVSKKYPYKVEYVTSQEVVEAFKNKTKNYLFVEYGEGKSSPSNTTGFASIVDCETQLPVFCAVIPTGVVKNAAGLDWVIERSLILPLKKVLRKK